MRNKYKVICQKCGSILFKKKEFFLEIGEIKCINCGLIKMPEEVLLKENKTKRG